MHMDDINRHFPSTVWGIPAYFRKYWDTPLALSTDFIVNFHPKTNHVDEKQHY